MKRDILKRFESYRESLEAQRKEIGTKSYWRIEGVNDTFRTLEDAKDYIATAYTVREASRLNGCSITHFAGEEIVSEVRISADGQGARYSRPEKC